MRVLVSESYLIQRLDHFSEELACTCDGSFRCGVEGTTSSRGGGCLLAYFFFLPHPFNIFFPFAQKKKKKGSKNQRRGKSGKGRPGSVTTQIQLLPCGNRRGGVGRREPHTRPPPRPSPAAAPGPGGPAEATPGDQLQKSWSGGGDDGQ